MERLGVPVTVIHKPGVGHHPHSLNNPEPIVHFILSALHRLPNECIHAVPGNEFRSGAGWVKGVEWHEVDADIKATLANRKLKLLLLGNSITQGWGGTRKAVAYKPGKRQWIEYLVRRRGKVREYRVTVLRIFFGVSAMMIIIVVNRRLL